MIEAVLPPAVAAVETFEDELGEALFPQEEAVIAAAVDKRRREFTTVRICARTALGRLGLPPVPILPGERGAPGWPPGVVGSMTHCAGYRAAAVARAEQVASLGLDAEPHEPLPPGVLESIATPGERVRLAELRTQSPAVCWDRLLFSAKESVYKTWYPITGLWLDFDEADITFAVAERTFTARLQGRACVVDGRRLTEFTGSWLQHSGLVLTAIVLARDRPSSAERGAATAVLGVGPGW